MKTIDWALILNGMCENAKYDLYKLTTKTLMLNLLFRYQIWICGIFC